MSLCPVGSGEWCLFDLDAVVESGESASEDVDSASPIGSTGSFRCLTTGLLMQRIPTDGQL